MVMVRYEMVRTVQFLGSMDRVNDPIKIDPIESEQQPGQNWSTGEPNGP